MVPSTNSRSSGWSSSKNAANEGSNSHGSNPEMWQSSSDQTTVLVTISPSQLPMRASLWASASRDSLLRRASSFFLRSVTSRATQTTESSSIGEMLQSNHIG